MGSFTPRASLKTLLYPLVLLWFAVPAAMAQQNPVETSEQAPAHISFVDGVAMLERDGTTDDSPASMPLLAGDRVRTRSGRVEILFADGSTLHLDHHSAIDLQSDELVRLLEGRIRLSIPGPARAVSYRIDAPHGWAHISEPGDYRVSLMTNVRGGELELAVIRGRAELVNEAGQTPLRAGERSVVRTGAAPSYAYVANSAALDAFDRWSEARRDGRLAASAEYLPDEVRPYASTFEQHGYWRDEPVYGRVWYPRVAVGWRPYYYGRWESLRPYGWTWIAHDPWGWPTHHYGRWGISPAGAWFWIPGRRWSAAWVSWAYAPGYVSWCPLGWNDRPIFHLNVVSVRGYDPWRAWTVLPRRHFGYGFVHRNVVSVTRIDHRVLSSFAYRDGAPEVIGRAVPRAAAPIRLAGTDTGRRRSAPLYTNLPADQARMRTDGTRIRVPGSSPAAAQPGAVTRERAVPSGPAVRSHRPADADIERVPGARSRRPDVRSGRDTGVQAGRDAGVQVRPGSRTGTPSRTDAGDPGARRRADAPAVTPRTGVPGYGRPGSAVRRDDASRAERPIERDNHVPTVPRRMDAPVYRGPAVPERRAPGVARPSSPSYDARPRALPRSEPPRPSEARAPQVERRGPDRAPSGSYERAPAQAQPSARPGGGSSAPPAGARPRGGGQSSGGTAARRPGGR